MSDLEVSVVTAGGEDTGLSVYAYDPTVEGGWSMSGNMVPVAETGGRKKRQLPQGDPVVFSARCKSLT